MARRVDHELNHARQMITDGVARAKIYETLMAEAKPRQVDRPNAPKLAKDLADKKAASFYPGEVTPPEPDQRYVIRPDGAPTKGPKDAPVVIVEFVDFQCPYCKKTYNREITKLLGKHGDNVQFAARNLPLEIHIEARGAALAALAADRQGQFWAFHDRLLSHEGPLGRNVFVDWATELGMDPTRFVTDMDAPEVLAAVIEDVRLAGKVGINGTPAFFVNGRYLSGGAPGRLTALVEEELAEADRRIAAGTKRGEVFESIMADAIPETAFLN
ncbi:MAG: thioredoxin domain-containing protein [Nannocystaceae bacterium]|nr:thioredoxin domain-containing protein [Nannocystaceae bacterium]